ncbi:helix-turn-helix domain-containing protein [Nonomuraea sp. NPDC059194]|uniref:helix-turn-helix domain-containing protein n=1 Tax=Nonomuraea sp. NPDC059194 TaxID=3346764 RepID=UPI0036AD9E58
MLDTAAVAQGDDVRREDVEQALQLAGFDRSLESLEGGSVLGRGAGAAGPARELRRMHGTGEYTIADLAELFSVSRPTVYRMLERAREATG